MDIAFIGMGIMGSRMAQRLMDSGHTLRIYNRTRNESCEELIDRGAVWCESPAIAVSPTTLIITMLSDPEAVKSVARGETGILKQAARGSVWMDCSTVDPEFSMTMAKESADKDVRFLDTPVAGSKGPAEKGELVFLVGGESDDLEKARPIMEILGKKVIHCGGPGQGSAMKLVVNYMLAQSLLSVTEASRIGQSLGLSEASILDTLIATPVAAPVIAGLRPRFEGSDRETHFPLKHMLKDLRLARKSQLLDLPLLDAAIKRFESLAGEGNSDFSYVYHAH